MSSQISNAKPVKELTEKQKLKKANSQISKLSKENQRLRNERIDIEVDILGLKRKIKHLLEMQREECRVHAQRCARDTGDANSNYDKWIAETPLINYDKI